MNKKEHNTEHTPTAEEVIKLLSEAIFESDGDGYEITATLPINDLSMKVLDIRGWGYLTSGGGLGMEFEEAIKVQQYVDKRIKNALNNHDRLTKENKELREKLVHNEKLLEIQTKSINERAKLIRELSKENKLMREALDSRAGKILLKGEPFFVVKASEPYAKEVVALIKEHEGINWTDADEDWANKAIRKLGDK